jgi:hypothetical protein
MASQHGRLRRPGIPSEGRDAGPATSVAGPAASHLGGTDLVAQSGSMVFVKG